MPRKTTQIEDGGQPASDTRLASTDRVAYTPKEFAGFFGKSATWGYRQLYAGKIKRLKQSASILIPRSELERFLKETVNHG